MLDAVACVAVEALGATTPSVEPPPGQAYVLGAELVGALAGHAHALAAWVGGGWRLVAPFEELSGWVVAEKLHACYIVGRWVLDELEACRVLVDGVPVLGARRPAIAVRERSATVDMEARGSSGDAGRASGARPDYGVSGRGCCLRATVPAFRHLALKPSSG